MHEIIFTYSKGKVFVGCSCGHLHQSVTDEAEGQALHDNHAHGESLVALADRINRRYGHTYA